MNNDLMRKFVDNYPDAIDILTEIHNGDYGLEEFKMDVREWITDGKE